MGLHLGPVMDYRAMYVDFVMYLLSGADRVVLVVCRSFI